tara:strand:- start:420 stop:1145 length:726 start_codon:yes stop_codon:yes gene_type:complete
MNSAVEKTPWQSVILTLFPSMFPGALGLSITGRALDEGIWSLKTLDIRNFARDNRGSVDGAPFGGGPGMVLRPDVIDDALGSLCGVPGRRIYLTPRGRRFNQKLAKELALDAGVVLVCGRYEGVDQRVIEAREMEEISVGDFILSGGELAAQAVLDSCVRLLPGVLGCKEGLMEESFENNLLEYPQYTYPRDWKGRSVPEVLLSGNHSKIATWRREQAEFVTRNGRPDLWETYKSRVDREH